MDSFKGRKGASNLGIGTCQPSETTRLAIQGGHDLPHPKAAKLGLWDCATLGLPSDANNVS